MATQDKITHKNKHMDTRDITQDFNEFYGMDYAVVQEKKEKQTW